MRLIAGKHRGLILKAPKGIDTRPTADRVREAIFSSIASRVPGARVLDLFAGTGAMGLEALSRGADAVVFCEKNKATQRVLQENIIKAKEEERATVYFGDALTFLQTRRCVGPFDLIFIDPPYASDLYEKTLIQLLKGEYLAPDALIVMESGKKPLFSIDDKVFLVYKERMYGETKVTYLLAKQ